MKTKFFKVLQLLGFDVLLLGLLEKLALWLIKKLIGWTNSLHRFLGRAEEYLAERKACACEDE